MVSDRPRHPQSQGLIEQTLYTLERMISAKVVESRDKSREKKMMDEIMVKKRMTCKMTMISHKEVLKRMTDEMIMMSFRGVLKTFSLMMNGTIQVRL